MKDGSDVFNNVSGSTAMTGGMDSTWIIERDRNSKEATLHITGRDLGEKNLKIKFNTDNYQWEYMGTVDDVEQQRQLESYNKSPILKTIKKLLEVNDGRWEGSATDLKNINHFIDDSVEKIGKFINNNEHFLLLYDNIKVKSRRTNRNKLYTFTYTTSTTNITDITNTTNTQQELNI